VEAKVEFALSLFNYSMVLQQTKNYKVEEECLTYALKLIQNIPNNLQARKVKAGCYCSLGMIYRENGDYKKAKEYLSTGIEKYSIVESKLTSTEIMRYKAFAICNLGYVYRLENDYKKCTELYLEGTSVFEKIAKEDNSPKALQDLALSYINISLVCEKEKQKDYLLKAYKITLSILEKYPDNKDCIMIKNAIEQSMNANE
jgi:tetratricopeptide (TPR) repeat protein